MPKINEIDLDNWKNCDVLTDSLWIINNRDNSGKHDGFYHGNFVPQIPRQLIERYTKTNDVVLDLFAGSGTTNFEAETLKRNCIGVEIQKSLVEFVNKKLDKDGDNFNFVVCGDSSSADIVKEIKGELKKHNKNYAQLILLHPPYGNIIKFSDYEKDLSNINDINNFRKALTDVINNALELLENKRYIAIVMGDKYENGQWIPLGFYCMDDALKCGLKLKSIIVKNMAGNRAKQNQEGIWRYRALTSDYYIFKHEYIFLFKKDKRK